MERSWFWYPAHRPRSTPVARAKTGASWASNSPRHWSHSPRGNWRNSLFSEKLFSNTGKSPKCSASVFTHKFLISCSQQMVLSGHLSFFHSSLCGAIAEVWYTNGYNVIVIMLDEKDFFFRCWQRSSSELSIRFYFSAGIHSESTETN